MKQSVVVIGANGQFGSDLVREFTQDDFRVIPLTHKDIEITDFENVREVLSGLRPNVVINTAAFHNVNQCEEEPETAYLINVQGGANVATVAAELKAKNVFISTDYVFDGQLPFGEFNSITRIPRPLNVYGSSKHKSEILQQEICDNTVIYRISSVFGVAGSSGKGGNFIEAVLNKVRGGQTAEVIDDTRMSPTYTKISAKLLRELVALDYKGIQHGSSEGQCSWFDLARLAASKIGLGDAVKPVQSEVAGNVVRPLNSSLATDELTILGLVNRHWTEAAEQYLREKGYLS